MPAGLHHGARASLLAILLSLLVTACGEGSGSGGGTPAGSCAVAEHFACIEWGETTSSNAQTACAYTRGTWSGSACAAVDRVGRCTYDYGSFTMTVSWYPGAGSAAQLETACRQASGPGGVVTTWTAG